MKTAFRAELEKLINRESMENGSDTPDFILAEYLSDMLEIFDRTVRAREKWYGRLPEKIPSYEAPAEGPDVMPGVICSVCSKMKPMFTSKQNVAGQWVCQDCRGEPKPCKSC